MIDVYSIASGAPIFLYTQVLSAMPFYTRISIDCHLTYGMAVAWQDMNGINTVVGLNSNPITFSGAVLLNGTMGETNVDVAFSHGGPLDVQYVYYNPGTGNMTESAYDFWMTLPLPAGSVVNPTVNDINPVGICQAGGGGPIDDRRPPHINHCPYPNIDCYGHGPANWAYTYTTNNSDISVRLVDLNTSPFAVTVVVNNASVPWPQIPTSGNVNMHPFLAYDHQCAPAITVGWYTNTMDMNTGGQAGYIALKMREDGLALISAPDYLTVSNNPTWASPTPVLSMSKQDDMSNVLYTVFPEVDGAGFFQMEHKYPPFCSNSYKGTAPTGPKHVCNDADKIAAFNAARNVATAKIIAHPNPFTASFVISLPAEYQDGEADIVITNIMGVVAGKYNGAANKANGYLNSLAKDLAPGTYMLSVNIKGKATETLKVVKTQ